MRLTRVAAAAGVLLALASGAARAAEPAECRTVRFADIGWADVTATTALASAVLKDLGYTPKLTQLTIASTYQALKAKQVDVFLGNWMPAMAADRKPYLADKSIEVLGPNLEGTKFTLAVPRYLYDKGLRDVSDIAKFGKELGDKIYGIEPGNDGNQQILDLIHAKQFGLEKFSLVDGGEPAMLAQLDRAYRAKRPILFLGWEPHPMNREYKLAYLTGGDAFFGPDFGAEAVYTNVRAGFTATCANVGKFLANLKFDLATEDALMEAILDKHNDASHAATAWLHAHASAVKPWLEGVTTFEGKPADGVKF